jgi:hypothetical protein
MRVRIGDRGQAASALRPSGEVMIGDRRWPARCADGWADAGAEVVVTAADAFGLVVRPAASVSPAGPANAGEAVPSADDLIERREARERRVWAEEKEIVRAAARRDNRAFALYLVLVIIPAAVAGHWLGGELGLKIALGVAIAVPLLLWAWASS